mmetsp:Transcript_4004/g.12592  ORF Transcript_4004/g.12592 Transcript_4004/m.12592 type:complete len:130 (-) Transcript_4004:77-466(-)
MGTVKLDESDLDEEDRQILAEIKKKGYYHGRPRSEDVATPQRIEADAVPMATGTRSEFDDYQRKWDKFDSDSYVRSLEPKVQKAPKPKATATAPSAGAAPQRVATTGSSSSPSAHLGQGAGPWAGGFKS